MLLLEACLLLRIFFYGGLSFFYTFQFLSTTTLPSYPPWLLFHGPDLDARPIVVDSRRSSVFVSREEVRTRPEATRFVDLYAKVVGKGCRGVIAGATVCLDAWSSGMGWPCT